MKKILFAALAMIVMMVSCVKDPQYPGATISDVKYTPTAVQADEPVTVSATITGFNEITAILNYSVNDGERQEVEMVSSAENNVYTAVIPGQANDTKVSFRIVAVTELLTISPDMEYTVGAIALDYSGLRLNEINGNDKFIEIYNMGSEALPLNGVYIEKDNEQCWVADNTLTLEAGAFLLLYSNKVEADHPDHPANLIFSSGLSEKKPVRIQMFTPAGLSIDDFNLVECVVPAPASYNRNADGLWYHAEATPGAANVEGTDPVLGLEGGEIPVDPYTLLFLNELNGDTKFIELYNMSDQELSLEGMTLMKDDYVDGAIWTADATMTIPAHGYLLLYSNKVEADHPELDAAYFFNAGLSGKKTIRMGLFMADGTERDVFTRGATGEWGQNISDVETMSYARTPDGGDWKLAEATPGAANPETGEDIPQE